MGSAKDQLNCFYFAAVGIVAVIIGLATQSWGWFFGAFIVLLVLVANVAAQLWTARTAKR